MVHRRAGGDKANCGGGIGRRLKRADEWFESTQAGQLNKGVSNGSTLSARSAIGAHGLEFVTHHVRCKSLPADFERSKNMTVIDILMITFGMVVITVGVPILLCVIGTFLFGLVVGILEWLAIIFYDNHKWKE